MSNRLTGATFEYLKLDRSSRRILTAMTALDCKPTFANELQIAALGAEAVILIQRNRALKALQSSFIRQELRRLAYSGWWDRFVGNWNRNTGMSRAWSGNWGTTGQSLAGNA